MKSLEKLKKYIFKKRPLISLICSTSELFYFLERNLKLDTSIGLIDITFNYKEADILIIGGFFTPAELIFIEDIVNEVSTKCKIFIYENSNLMLNTSKVKSADKIEKLILLITDYMNV